MEPVRIGERLRTAAGIVKDFPRGTCIADIGTDHGKLSYLLLGENPDWTCIATDISVPSLNKARELLRGAGMEDRARFREGDGFSVLKPGEANAVFCLGIGGEQIRDFLISTENSTFFTDLYVFQPMKGIEELREYLYAEGYRIQKDLVVCEHGRYFQILAVRPPDGGRDIWPDGFPEGCFSVGYKAYEERTETFRRMMLKQRDGLLRNMETARGSEGEKNIQKRLDMAERILEGLACV